MSGVIDHGQRDFFARITTLEQSVRALQMNVAPPWTALTLGTNCAYWGVPFGVPSYTLVGNLVFVSGLILTTAALATGAIIATIPVAAAPSFQLIVIAMGDPVIGTNSAMRLDVKTTGAITVTGAVASGAYISLAGISYPSY